MTCARFILWGALQAGKLRFDNVAQETPIQELRGIQCHQRAASRTRQSFELSRANAGSRSGIQRSMSSVEYVRGRYIADERTMPLLAPHPAAHR